jgi:hypothetical protein
MYHLTIDIGPNQFKNFDSGTIFDGFDKIDHSELRSNIEENIDKIRKTSFLFIGGHPRSGKLNKLEFKFISDIFFILI